MLVMSNKIRVGVVILNYNTWDDTVTCIKSIRRTYNLYDYKIYLVDNASPIRPNDEFYDFLNNSTDIEFLESKENNGYSAGNNIGIELCLRDGCDYIMIANNDIIFTDNSIQSLLGKISSNSKIGIIGPKILNRNSRIQKSNKIRKPSILQKVLTETLLRSIFKKTRDSYIGTDYNSSQYVYSVSGCLFVMSRECAISITPFDENTFLFGEENIIGFRMLTKEYKTLYYPKSIVYHLHGASTKNIKAFSYICRVESEIYFLRKYLKKPIIYIAPLLFIRITSYLLFCTFNKDFRNNLTTFISKIRLKLSFND